MIEDKESGLLVADNEDEKFWIETKQEAVKMIEILEKQLKFNKAVLKMCEDFINE